jgi:hypothetical protein
MRNLVLFDKIYAITKEKTTENLNLRYLNYLNEFIEGFGDNTVEIKKIRSYDQRLEITINGPEEGFIFNLLKKEVGTIHDFDDIKIGESYKGNLIDVGKIGFGIFVDCAILNPKVDVLLTLRELRNQLCAGKKKSVKEIIKTYDFIENFPVITKILKINKEKKEVEGVLDKGTLNLYHKIINENLEAVFVSGATKNQFKKAIFTSGHIKDIISIERFGFLEQLVLLKEGTQAPGIIAEIGKYLENCKLGAIRYDRIKNLFL